MSGIKNVVLIDRAVAQHKLFAESCNSSTIPILYSHQTTRDEIRGKLAKIGNIDRIAFVFHEPRDTYTFLNNDPLFSKGSKLYSSKNVLFLVDMFRKHQVKNADFLACNTLKLREWKSFYGILEKHTATVVGASDDATGNLKYGGDWVMERTQENVRNVYFTSKLSKYSGLLMAQGFSIVELNGKVYVSGKNLSGQLGLGHTDQVTQFTEVTSLEGHTIIAVAAGSDHSLVLTDQGQVFAAGNGAGAGMGTSPIGSLPTTNTFQLVPELDGLNIVKISCGSHYSVALDNLGKVYVTGSNINGQLGTGDMNSLEMFTLVADLDPFFIEDIACGSDHTLALGDNGIIHATGRNDYGQLGIDSTDNRNTFVSTGIPFDSYMDAIMSQNWIPAHRIFAGSLNSFALTAGGQLYGTGDNDFYQFGNNSTFYYFQSLDVPTAVTDVAAGPDFTLILSEGQVLGTGSNDVGQLGMDGVLEVQTFTQVPTLADVNVRQEGGLVVGDGYSIVIPESQTTLYVAGDNESGQLGTDQPTVETYEQPSIGVAPEVGTAEGYATEIANEVPTYQNLTPSPSDLQTSSSNKVANAQAVNYDTNMSVPELEGKKPTIQGYLNEITPLKTTLEGYLTNINGVLETYNTYEDQMTEWVNNDPNLSQSDKDAIQEHLTNLQASGNTLLNIKTNIENAITAVSGDITTVNGILSDIDAKIAVVTSTGYTNTISSELTGQENLSPSPTALETEANGIITSAGSIVSKTTTPANILQSNYDTVQGYYNTITLSKTTLEGYLTDIDSVIANGNTYKTAMSGYLADASITGTDRSSIQSSYDSVSNNVTSLGGVKTTIEGSLASVSADAVTIGALFTQVGGVLNAVVCFPGDTPVTTDQGEIKIKELVAGEHTIDGKRIKYITKVRNEDSTLTCIRRNAIEEGVPSRKTLITNEHLVEFHGEMVQAGELVDMVDGAFKVKYNGEPVYNVVMEKKDTMMVNGLRCETLDPKSRCLLAMMLCERVINEQNPREKARLGMGLKKVMKKMKLEDIRKRRGVGKN